MPWSIERILSNLLALLALERGVWQASSAKLDTQAYNVTVAQHLASGLANGSADGGLTKLGSGTLTLTGKNTYAGGTLISAGELVAASKATLRSGSVELAAGARLTLVASVTITTMFNTILTLDDASTSTINLLGPGVQDTVAALVIDGVAQPLGTYGAESSGSQYTLASFLAMASCRWGWCPIQAPGRCWAWRHGAARGARAASWLPRHAASPER